MSPVIYAKYKTEKFLDSVNLIQYFKIKPNKSLPANLQKRQEFLTSYKALNANISTDIDRMTKILTMTVKMPEPELSANIVNNIAESLDNYIRTKRKSYASEQRDYIEKRLFQVKDSLTIAENTLKDFSEQNRMVMQSPELMLQQARLARKVQIIGAVFIELSKQLEIAKIDEVKNTPVLNIKELAKDPILKAGPKRLNSLILIIFLSAIFSIAYFISKDALKKYALYAGIDFSRIKKKISKSQ